MKRIIMMTLAFLMALGALDMATSRDAEAQISLELVGKLGGESNWVRDEWLGDSKFGVSGGLRFAALARFSNNFGVGLNFNWTMADQRLDVKRMQLDLGDRSRRNVVIQHPSFGVTFRYLLINMIDIGIWANYGFGSVKYDPIRPTDATKADALAWKYNTDSLTSPSYVDLNYDLQTFELGFLAHCSWYIPNTTLAIIVGAEFFMNFSYMEASDTRMYDVKYKDEGYKDENHLDSFGFAFVFGVGYDFYFDSFGRQLEQ